MTLLLAVAFVASVCLSLVITPWVVRFADARGFHETVRGEARGPRRPVSRLGGIAIFAATVLSMVIVLTGGALVPNAAGRRFLLGLLVGGTITFALGLYDDIRGARPKTKLVVQVLVALLMFAMGVRINSITIGAVAGVETGWLSLPLTVLWIVGVTNAFNLIDGMDGLATGIGLVVLCTVGTGALMLHNRDVVLLALLLVGALLGFMPYNVSPARIFLGDSGSLFIGFMLSVLSIHGSLKSTTAVLVAIPVFALAVPLLDTGLAILRRLLRGSPVFGADARHIHHQLLAVGLTPNVAAAVLWGVAAAFAILGLTLAFAPRPLLLSVAITGGLLATALILYGIRQLKYVEFVEAALTVVRRGGGMRREIRNQIHARELVEAISRTTSLDELNAVLAERRYRFGFAQMEINYGAALQPVPQLNEPVRLLKLDYPITMPAQNAPLILRIWSVLDNRDAMQGAERVARILAPAVEHWVAAAGIELPTPVPFAALRRRSTDAGLHTQAERLHERETPWPVV